MPRETLRATAAPAVVPDRCGPDVTQALRPTAVVPLMHVTRDQREIVRLLHDVIKLTDGEIAEATGVAQGVTVRAWRSRAAKSHPRNTTQIDDLRAIVGLLLNSGLLEPEEVGRFLRSRNANLNYRRPLSVLAQGQFERVRETAELLLERLAGLDETADHPGADDRDDLPDGMERLAPRRPEVVGSRQHR